jgi:hypothetical protein
MSVSRMAIGGLICLLCLFMGLPEPAVSVFPDWFPVMVVLLADVWGRRVSSLRTTSGFMEDEVAGTEGPPTRGKQGSACTCVVKAIFGYIFACLCCAASRNLFSVASLTGCQDLLHDFSRSPCHLFMLCSYC